MTEFLPSTWFSRIGLPLNAQEQACIAGMLRELDFAVDAPIAGAASWQDAARAIRADETDSRWWNAEEAERERLWHIAAERLTESDLLARLAAATGDLGAVVLKGASLAAARAGGADPGLVRAATDAALLAAHQRALANFAGVAGGHYFLRKFELFVSGRWPLGVCSGSYVVF